MHHGRKVLVVDHNVMDILSVEEHLKTGGYEVSRLSMPHGAVAKIDFERPDVLLVDITMPRLDVQGMLDHVRHQRDLEDMVIVLFSDLDAATLQNMCVENDIHGYYCKSMDVTRIASFLDQFYEEEPAY